MKWLSDFLRDYHFDLRDNFLLTNLGKTLCCVGYL